jgi:hypothetical protein
MAVASALRSWPSQLSKYWIESAEVLSADANEEEKPGRDSLGNPGRVLVVRHSGRLGVRMPRGRVVERMATCGLTPVRDTAEETELEEARSREISDEIDPFLLEKTVVVTVRGREFAGDQRAVIEMKVARLRKEFEDAATREDRRAAAGKMLRDLEEGLSSTLDVRSVERRFRPAVSVTDPVASIGSVVPLRPGSRIVYSVAAVKPEPGDDAEAEPMVFHIVGLGAREAVLLYTGGVHGQRHLRDLEESCVHHAWFANRERVKTEATAPWIGRKLYRDLVANGCGEIVVHKRRDPMPVAVDKVGEGVASVVVDGRPTDLPVIHCRTSRDDELSVLADPDSPLLLRLVEAGAEIVRTIDAIHTVPAHPFAFTPGADDASDADTVADPSE